MTGLDAPRRPSKMVDLPYVVREYSSMGIPLPMSTFSERRAHAKSRVYEVYETKVSQTSILPIALLDLFISKSNDTMKLAQPSHPSHVPQVAKLGAEGKIEVKQENYDDIMAKTLSSHKSECLKLKMAINRHVGQVCDSWDQIKRVTKELITLAKQSPEILRAFIMITIVDKVLNLAETQCALHTPSSFPLAALIINISNNIPEFCSVFKKRLQERCPPLFSQEFKGSIIEDLEKKCGVVCLYAAILSYSSHMDKGSKNSGFDIRDGWKFVASTLNRAPSIYTSAFMCYFLEISGYCLWITFGPNFYKLMHTIKNVYISKLPGQSKSYNESLKILVDSFCSERKVSKPKGMDINEE